MVVTLCACRKNKGESVLDYSPDFEEQWHCEGIYTEESNKANVISFSYGTRKGGTYASYSDNGGIDWMGYTTIKGNVITLRDDFSFTKKAHTFNVDEFPVKLNTIDGKWWRMKLNGITYYCHKGATSINTCGSDGYEINVWNPTNDTINGVYNNHPHSIAPNSGLGGDFRFASDVSYTDNRGNSFTYKAMECSSNNEVQLH